MIRAFAILVLFGAGNALSLGGADTILPRTHGPVHPASRNEPEIEEKDLSREPVKDQVLSNDAVLVNDDNEILIENVQQEAAIEKMQEEEKEIMPKLIPQEVEAEKADDVTMVEQPEGVGCGRFVETLKNVGEGAAYMGKIYIGGQGLAAIWDTGSDQQVVNSLRTFNPFPQAHCLNNQEHCYNPQKSGLYKQKDVMPSTISYGSGDTMVLVGEDQIQLEGAHCTVQRSQFQELLSTNINQILRHDIDVVAGLSPHRWGVNGTQQLMTDMHISFFSFCFQRDTDHGDGFLVWNDHNPKHNPTWHFTSLPTIGVGNYWSVAAHDFKLEHNSFKKAKTIGYTEDFGGCIVDTGTSLVTLDKPTLENLEKYLNEFMESTNFECSEENLHKLPDLTFRLGDKRIEHRLRPQDYISYTTDNDIPEEIQGILRFWGERNPLLGKNATEEFIKSRESKQCVLMFTEPMENNVCLLGMPFMRNYYVTFDREHKTVNTALHNGKCEAVHGFREVETEHKRLRHINPNKFVVSGAYRKMRHHAAKALFKSAGPLHERL